MMPTHIELACAELIALSELWLGVARRALQHRDERALRDVGQALCQAQRAIEDVRRIIATEAIRDHHRGMQEEAACAPR